MFVFVCCAVLCCVADPFAFYAEPEASAAERDAHQKEQEAAVLHSAGAAHSSVRLLERKREEEKAVALEKKEEKDRRAKQKEDDARASDWKRTSAADYTPPQPNAVDSKERVTVRLLKRSYNSPIHFFRLLFTPAITAQLVLATNGNAWVREGKSYAKTAGNWEHTTAEEVDALLASLIYMGFVQCDNIHSYWEGVFEQPFISSRFSRDRFLSLFRSLSHNADPPQTPEEKGNRFYEIQSFVDALNDRFGAVLVPGARVVVDETMIKYRGEHPSIQKMRDKPIKVGYKGWSLATIDGYMIRLTLYEGKKEGVDSTVRSVLFLLCSPVFSFCVG